jgi:hypothetical protein
MKSIDTFAKAGVYGVVFEGIKYFAKKDGTIKHGSDYVYPSDVLKKHFEIFRDKLHDRGMKFYSGENRLRSMGDDLCCCGIDGMGWRPNRANLNHYLFDRENYVRENYVFTDSMNSTRGNGCFQAISQDSLSTRFYSDKTFSEIVSLFARSKKFLKTLLP